ncbi:MAG: hypothetical protein JNL70_18865 [Saprospiraceae bacterium]|nr:hypothetical protein [Saprospiraceae bacterium]
MKRRTFVTLAATTPLLGFTTFPLYAKTNAPTKPVWLIELIKLNDKNIATIPSTAQITDKSLKSYGAILDGDDIPSPQSTGNFISKWAMALSCPESNYYQSTDLLKKIEMATRYLLSVQHKDGTIDLLGSNFNSPPDTAFSVDKVAPAYRFIKASRTKGSETVLDLLKNYLQRAGESLIVGGIHTPNHRWVVSAALMKLNDLWADTRYIQRAEEWLLEHIDLDAEGQYTEKSTGGYTPLVNRMIITMSKGLKKPELLEFVRKSLIMTFYYVHPNGEVVTESSNRQDKGTIGHLDAYYYAYRYLALLDKNGEFAAMCRLIEKTAFQKMLGNLDAFLEDPTFWQELPNSKPLPTSYAKAFPLSGAARIRRDDWDATLLTNNAGFLTFHKGDSVLQAMRLVASFFGKGQFQTEEIKKEGDSWILSKKLEGPYYQPYPKDQIDPNGDLSKMPRTNRPKSEIQYLETTVKITETIGGIVVDIDMHGTEGVPVTFELVFRQGGTFAGVQAHATKPNAYFFKESKGTYTLGRDTIQFSSGRMEHKGILLRGGLPAMDAPTVYLTGFTPFVHRVVLS